MVVRFQWVPSLARGQWTRIALAMGLRRTGSVPLMVRVSHQPSSSPLPVCGRSMRRLWVVVLAAILPVSFAAEPLKAGAQLETLPVGSRVYRQVQVRQIGAGSVVFLHEGGLTSVRLQELSPEWQQRFDYSLERELSEGESRAAERREAEAKRARQRAESARVGAGELASTFEQLIHRLGDPVVVRPEVDLRPRFLDLGVKDQGRRPSCSVFAVVSALEYQNALLTGQKEKLSEEYLIWATRQVIRRRPPDVALVPSENDADAEDAGFSLPEVVTALRVYGIPPHARMPNTFGSGMAGIAAPPADVMAEARERRRVYIHLLAARDREGQIVAITHALNAGIPVVIGLRWPHDRSVRGGVLSEQKPIPDYAHAVTLVGYVSPDRRLENNSFIFKNSYGVRWGQGGYGRVTYRYLQEHLLAAVMLEVQPPANER
jgi:hypothetical protein